MLTNSPYVLNTVFCFKTKVTIEAMPDIVAIKNV
jgi:hypothetical protein